MTRNRKEIFGAARSRNGQAYWTRIGVAFENADSSWNLLFNYLPTHATTTIQLRNPRSADGSLDEPGTAE
jgi:hypothetical protein